MHIYNRNEDSREISIDTNYFTYACAAGAGTAAATG
jgi:hypothetical protein